MSSYMKNWALLLGLISALTPVGCSEDEDTGASSAASRGESCHSRLDCAAGLACIGNTCTLATFVYKPTGKECVEIECREVEDCCDEPSPTCAYYQTLCSQGSTSYCTLYQTECVCDAATVACENDRCVDRCQTDSDCLGLGSSCVASKCVECASDAQCSDTQICKNQECVEKCTEKIDCPYFEDCMSGTCVKVGCADDRECVAALNHVLAFCTEEKECKVPCQTDAECQAGEGYSFSACIDKFCVDIGCETDEECRLRPTVGPGEDAACREPTNL